MAYARQMYQTAEQITAARNVEARVEDDGPFQTYSAPMVYIAQMINTLVTQAGEDRLDKEVWYDMITAGALLQALRNCVSMYVYRTGTWIEYNMVFGNRLAEVGRPNHGIPTNPKLISRMDRCMKEYTRLVYILDELILIYLWNLGDDSAEKPQTQGSTESKTKYRAWIVRYRWQGMSDRYLLFKPRYSGENSGRRRQQAACGKRRIHHDKQLGRSRRWEGGADQCKFRMSDNQTPISDLHEDLEGLFRKTIRTIVDNRSRAFAKFMRTQVNEEEDMETARKPRTYDRSEVSSEARRRQHEEGKSKVAKPSDEPLVKGVIKRTRWMITWTRLETASPFPELETYI